MGEGHLVVAIDGPAGVGKSTIARDLARRLGLQYLDTGAMYRAIALAAARCGVDPADRAAVEELVRSLVLDLVAGPDGATRVVLEGELAGQELRRPEIGTAASRVAAHPGVRRRLVDLQREFARRHGGVLEGRDIGTVVVPETPHKFFLSARSEVRARRRWEQLGRTQTLVDVAEEVRRRDERDATRSESPLVCDDSYRRIDTSDRSPAEIVDEMMAYVLATAE